MVSINTINKKGGEKMVQDMDMTNKQFQAFIRLLDLVRKLIETLPKEEREAAMKEYESTIQLIKEDS